MSKRTVIKADEELVIKGKLTVEGNVTQIETTQVVNRLESNSLVINSDGENVTAELTLNSDGTEATISFDNSDGEFNFNKPLNLGSFPLATTGNISGANIIGTYLYGNGSNISGLTTSIVSEGANLYYTVTRANSAIDARVTTAFVNALAIDYNSLSNTPINVSEFINDAGYLVAANLVSLTANVDSVNGQTGVVTLDTGDIAENGNLYFTTARANSAMDARLVGGDGIDYTAGTIAVDSTVVRTTGDQTITGNTSFVGTTSVTGSIVPTAANTYNLGSWANHFDYVFANVLHAEYLDLEDANIADIHNSFYVGSASSPSITRSGYGLTFTHNASGAYYEVNAGDGLQISGNNVAVDSTVVRTTGDQTITGNIGINGTLTVAGTINSQNVEDTYVKDTKITLNSNAAVDNTVSIEVNRPVAGANTYIKWDESTDQWKFTNNGSAEFLLPTSTTDLNEGANLYYTPARANTAMDTYLVGGAGLTYSSGTFAVGAGTGITVNADDVQLNADYVKNLISGSNGISYNSTTGALTVDSTVIRTTGNQSLANVKTFTGELVIPQNGISPTNNGSIYHDNVDVFAVLNGAAVKLTPQSDVGEIEDVGSTGVDIYAGYRLVAVGNANIKYHGIRSITNGSYIDISEASNVITVAGNATGIRGLISASGNISYDSANGIISENLTTTDIDEGNNLYFTAARARGNISGTGLITYNSNTGVISTTADNYSNWNVQTGSGAGATHGVTSNSTVIISGGTGITVTNTGGNITIASTNSADIEAVSAGDGLTGGGVSGAVTLNVGAGAGITVNADNVALSTSGVVAGTYGNASAVSQLVIDAYGRTTSAANVPISISASQVSDFTSTANTAIDARVSGGAGLTYSSGVLAVGAGDGITVNADSVEINVAHIRNQFSALSPLSYNAAIGQFSISEVGDISEVVAGDGLTGGGTSGSVTLNIGAGAGITVNADNVALSTSGVTSGTYGSANSVSQLVVDTYGRTTSATNVAISISASQVSDFTSAANTAIDARIIGGSGLTYSGGTLAVGAGTGISVSADAVSVSGLTISEFANATIQTSSELFVDSDTVLMTAAAVFDKINAIQAGQGISKSSTGDGDAVLDVDLTDITVFTSTNVASRAVVRDASGNFAANVITATATTARYADLAENYLGDADYEPGTVLVFGGDAEVTACVSHDSTRVAGVVTTQPAHVMNSDLTGNHVTCIALRGRVPVKVKGVVRKGDVLVTAGEGFVGYAVAALYPRDVPAASIVGKAITDKLDNGPGVVEALI